MVIATVAEYMDIVILQQKMDTKKQSMEKGRKMLITLFHKGERQ